ncbi:hypothetical protein J2X36_003674 [Methylobacterium sp. BE186]|uniref:hypothetical protein n=1 Tax=Methylobacterium sp. BE186 TaxID=2817715 RepID=UPI00285C3272|nr:hypothetical protein [Methylobacterium sp. BE186]MDR7038902.1 hypothetical protein [Methylobacterium sp. BE186]
MLGPALVMALALAAATPSRAGDLPAPVEAAIREQRQACAPEKAEIRPGFIARKDVNGDGIEDVILDYGAFACGGDATYFCGSAGCTMQVFASTKGGYAKVLDENVRRLDFKHVKGRPAMLLGLHGNACGKAGIEPCGTTLYWTGTRFDPSR